MLRETHSIQLTPLIALFKLRQVVHMQQQGGQRQHATQGVEAADGGNVRCQASLQLSPCLLAPVPQALAHSATEAETELAAFDHHTGTPAHDQQQAL